MIHKTSAMRRCALAVAMGGMLAIVGGAAALGHGILKSASPAPDAEVTKPPSEVSTTLTESPLPDGRYIVRDGCDRVVSTNYTVQGDTISARVNDAQPGNWKVRFDFISSVDGHRYNQTYSFTVAGTKDCSKPEEEEDADEDADRQSGASSSDDAGASETEEGDDGHVNMASEAPTDESRIPVVPLAATSVVVLGLAILGRRPKSSGR
jgi:copper resistance protein C